MKNDNFYKTLRIVCLILAIVCMALSLFKKAKADTIPSYMQDTYSTYIDECTNISVELKQDVKNYINNFEYSFMAEFYNNGSVYERVIYLTNYSDMGFCSWYGWTGYGNTYFSGTRCSNSRWNDGGITLPNNISTSSASFSAIVILYNSSSSITLYCNKFTPTEVVQKSSYNLWLYYNHSYSRAINNVPYYSDYSTPYNYAAQNNQANVKCFLYEGADDFKYFYSSEYDRFSGITALKNLSNIEYFEAPPSTSTAGFNVFKYNNLGTDTLRIVPPQNQVPVGTHSSNVSTVTFDLVIDGTTIPCEYNSESEYYFESLEYARAYYEIPLNVLLPSSINDFDEVYVTNVRYVNSWSNQGGETSTNTFVYVDKCYIKRSIGNDDVGQVTITHIDTNTGYTDTEINNINNMISNASTLQGSFDVEKNLSGGSSDPFSFSSFQDAVVREIECWHPTGTKTSDWVSITIDGVTYDSGDNMYWLEYDSNSTQSFDKRYNYNISPYSYVRENNYSGYYDIIYFIVHEMVYDSSGTGISTLDQTYTRYYYFISDRYYNKLILYREMDILTYIKLNNEIGEKTYNYLFDRLLNIDDNLYYYIKDKAAIDNDILDALENIDNDMQFNLDIVMDLLNKILDALLNLNIEFPEADYTDILEKLDTIIDNQDTSDINDDWYQNYREWLYGINENDSYLSPHEYFNNIFGTLKTTFDSFTNNISFNAYLLKVEDFINHISGSTTDNLTIYLRDGIGDPGFNINNNYMYTVGGS